MAFGNSLSSVMGFSSNRDSLQNRGRPNASKDKDASKISVRKPPREKSHFTGLGPSNPLVMAPKQDTPDMQPKLGAYPGNQSPSQTRPNRSTGLPSGMPTDLGMSMGPSMQPAVMQGMNQSSQGVGPSMESLDPLLRRRLMSSRPAGF